MSRVLKYALANADEPKDAIVAIPENTVKSVEIDDGSPIGEDEFVETISPMQIAEMEAKRFLDAAKFEARQIKDDATAEAMKIKAAAEKQGYDKAFQDAEFTINERLLTIDDTLATILKAQAEYENEYSRKLGDFAVDIASKILKKEIELDSLVMFDLVEDAMGLVKEAKWVVVHLSRELVPLIELLKSELPEKYKTIPSLQVLPKDIPMDAGFIESDKGSIDFSIGEQLENLKRRFEQLNQKTYESN